MVDPGSVAIISTRGLRVVSAWSALTFVACLSAAGGEIWRWVLLLRGRTEVLSGTVVAGSDAFVHVAATVAGVLGLGLLIVVVPLLVRLHRAAERRAGLASSRRPAAVLARLIVPGWNLYGAGQILAEIGSQLAAANGSGHRRRGGVDRLLVAWWLGWIGNAVLVVVTLGRAFGRSVQAMADTVQLHAWLDLAAGASAALTAAVLLGFARRVDPGRDPFPGWRVAPPAPTRGRSAVETDDGSD